MIPESIDILNLIDALNAFGWNDYKIEMELEFTKGYIGQIRCGNIKNPPRWREEKLREMYERCKPTLITRTHVLA